MTMQITYNHNVEKHDDDDDDDDDATTIRGGLISATIVEEVPGPSRGPIFSTSSPPPPPPPPRSLCCLLPAVTRNGKVFALCFCSILRFSHTVSCFLLFLCIKASSLLLFLLRFLPFSCVRFAFFILHHSLIFVSLCVPILFILRFLSLDHSFDFCMCVFLTLLLSSLSSAHAHFFSSLNHSLSVGFYFSSDLKVSCVFIFCVCF